MRRGATENYPQHCRNAGGLGGYGLRPNVAAWRIFWGGAGARMQSDGQNTEPFESLVKLVSNTYGNPAMIQKQTLAVIYPRLADCQNPTHKRH